MVVSSSSCELIEPILELKPDYGVVSVVDLNRCELIELISELKLF